MKLNFKNNFLGYFQFYYSVIGNKVLINLLLCIIVSFMDGLGLAMFMPLLQAVNTGDANPGKESMGQLHYITDAITNMGFTLNLNTVLLMMISLFIVKGIMKFVQLNFQVNMRHLFMKRIRYRLVDGLHELNYPGFLKMDAGKIQNTLLAEVQRLFQTMNFYFNAAQNAVMLVTYILLAFLANYQFALLVALGAGITNFLYRKIYIATKKASSELSKKGDDFNSYLLQAVHYFKYLKATNYFDRFEAKLKGVIDQTERINQKMGGYNAVTVSVKEPMIVTIVVLVIYMQVNWMGAGLGAILLSLILFYRALSFLVSVQNHWQSFVQNIGAMHNISAFINDIDSAKEIQVANPLLSFEKEIKIENVHFSYNENKTLDDVNVIIPKNKTVAFVGESGSGKTTLANMVSGLLKPQSGNLTIDGVSMEEYNTDSYRKRIGYISQEPVIFNDNIYNNITFWAEPTTENIKRFNEVIDMASLTTFIDSLPEKERTHLGDNGILISGGQRQRISIARELYKNAEILIMDEATSALDSETERMIQENLEALRGHYTMIIVAHRLSTIKDADIIYLLETGKITAFGDFETMIAKSPRFKRMVALQEV